MNVLSSFWQFEPEKVLKVFLTKLPVKIQPISPTQNEMFNYVPRMQ